MKAETMGREAAARWEARPRIALAIRALAVLGPVVASVVGTLVVSSIVPRPTDRLGQAVWWLGLSGIATLVALVTERAARRLLPLASLLTLSMVFPDEAPSRFDAALRRRTAADLEEALDQAKLRGGDVEDPEAAERLLQLLIALNTHDRRTRGHADRVKAYSELIAAELDLPEPVREKLRWAAMLHDVGKLDVSADLLNLPRRPNARERQELERHAEAGAALVRPLSGWLGEPLRAVAEHHERWDGTGYPRRLVGGQISLAARIVAVADAFDAMTAPKTYQQPVSAVEARAELTRFAGSQFDPDVVRAFLNISLGRLRLVMGPLAWMANIPVLTRIPAAASLGTALSALAVTAGLTAPGAPTPEREVAEVAAEAPPDTVEFVPADSERPEPPPGRRPPATTTTTTTVPAATTPDEEDPPPPTSTTTPPPPVDPPAPPPVDPPVDPPPTPGPPPVAVPVREAIDEDERVTVRLGAAGETVEVEDPGAGSVTRDGGHRFTYEPPPDWSGTASFPYRLCDEGCSSSTVTITVRPVNDPPRLRVSGARTVDEDAAAQVVHGWADVDAGPRESGQGFDVEATVDDPSLFSSGPRVDDAGNLRFTPAPDANGSTTLRVQAVDVGGGNDTSPMRTTTLTVRAVNDTPSISGAADQAVAEDAGPQQVDGWAAASAGPADEAGQAVTFTVTADDPTLFSAGPAVAADGDLTFTPAADTNGTTALRLTATDDGGGDDTDTRSAMLTVEAVDDAPQAADDVAVMDEDGTGVTVDVLENDTDADGQALYLVDHDSSTLDGGSVSVAGSSFIYVPDPDVAGDDTFTYRVTDGTGGFDQATVTVTVQPVADAPRAADDGYLVDQDTPLTVADPGLVSNDGDPDGDPFLVDPTAVAGPQHGGLTLSAGGGFVYTPDPGFAGQDQFTYRIEDATGRAGSASVTLTVADDRVEQGWYLGTSGRSEDDWDLVADPLPAADPVPDTDGDGDPGLTVHHSGGGLTEENGDSYQHWWLTPDAPLDLDGPVRLELWGALEDFRVEDDPIPTYVWLHDCAADGTDCQPRLSASIGDEWDGGAVDFVEHDLNLGTLTTTIAPGRALRLRLMFDRRDMWVASTDAFRSRLILTEVNDPPVALADTLTVAEDSGVTSVDVLANDSDPDLDPASVSVSTAPARGVAVAQPDGTVDYTPAVDAFGPDGFDYEVCDTGGACSTASVAITVTGVPDAPRANDDGFATDGGLLLTVPASSGVLANDADPDGDPLTVDTLPVSGPSLGVLLLAADGSFVYTPLPLVSGTDTFVYRVRDDTGRTATATATITVGGTGSPARLFLGTTGAGPDDWDLVDAAPAGPTEPDHDGDGHPGLTIAQSSPDLSETSGDEYQHWHRVVTTPLVLDGPVSLDLWSTVEQFSTDAAHVHVFLSDCPPSGPCSTLLSPNLQLDPWSNGTWTRRTINLGSLDTTIPSGHTLRLRLMFDRNDVWVALTGPRSSSIEVRSG